MLKRRFKAFGGLATLQMGALGGLLGKTFSYMAPVYQFRANLSPKQWAAYAISSLYKRMVLPGILVGLGQGVRSFGDAEELSMLLQTPAS